MNRQIEGLTEGDNHSRSYDPVVNDAVFDALTIDGFVSAVVENADGQNVYVTKVGPLARSLASELNESDRAGRLTAAIAQVENAFSAWVDRLLAQLDSQIEEPRYCDLKCLAGSDFDVHFVNNVPNEVPDFQREQIVSRNQFVYDLLRRLDEDAQEGYGTKQISKLRQAGIDGDFEVVVQQDRIGIRPKNNFSDSHQE